jgi:hypothetical protein
MGGFLLGRISRELSHNCTGLSLVFTVAIALLGQAQVGGLAQPRVPQHLLLQLHAIPYRSN